MFNITKRTITLQLLLLKLVPGVEPKIYIYIKKNFLRLAFQTCYYIAVKEISQESLKFSI